MRKIKFITGQLEDNIQRRINAGFEAHSQQHSAPKFEKEQLNWLVYNDTKHLIGALTAVVLWDWLYIDELWVDSNHRGAGLGKQLMLKAEDFAASQELTGLWLWTQSWQAAEFYQKLGYCEFTRFEDFPKGHSRIGFRKYFHHPH